MSRRSSPSCPAVRETERTVVGVHGAPKPPPVRISLTLPAIRAAREVWLLAAGEDKAEAAAIALSGAGEVQAPAAGAYGRRDPVAPGRGGGLAAAAPAVSAGVGLTA